MAEADEDEDGFINYHEFVPVAVQVLQGYHARRHAMEHRDKDEQSARDLAMDYLLHGMSREELEATMFKLFQKADLDHDGFLDRNEFRACINDASLNLSRREINLLMAEADGDADGKISYDEFVPLCFDLLLKNLQDDIFLLQRNRGELENYLLEIFQYADSESSGFLAHSDIVNLLELANLGLSQLQIATIVSAAKRDSQSQIAYHKFISVAAEMIAEMFHANMLSDRRKGQVAPQDVNDLSSEELKSFLTKLFSSAGSDTGELKLPPRDFKRVLLSTDVGFSPEQMRRMLVEADEDEANLIDCTAFVDSAVGVLEAMQNKQCFKDPERLREREAEELAKEFSVHAQSREQLEGMLGGLFQEEDTTNSGQVDRAQLRRVVFKLQASMQLERREVNALLISADEDNEGLLTYGDFVTLAYDVLRQAILDILIDSTPQSAQLEQYLVELCQAEDPRNCGSLPEADLRLIIMGSDLQLSDLQIDQVMEVAGSGNSVVQYKQWAHQVSALLARLLTEPTSPTGAAAQGFDWEQIEQPEVETFLLQLLKDAADIEPEASGKGNRLSYRVVKVQLSSIDMGGGHTLNPAEVRVVLSCASVDDFGMVDCTKFAADGSVVLRGLRSNVLLEVLNSGWKLERSVQQLMGRSVEELRTQFQTALQQNDLDRDGKVTHRQFCDALETLAVPAAWVSFLATCSDPDALGLTEIAPTIVQSVLEGLSVMERMEKIEEERAAPPPLSKRLLEALTAADSSGAGVLDSATVKGVLRDLNLGLKERHIITIISAAEKKDDMINYSSFSKYAAGVIGDIASKEQDVTTQPRVIVQVNEYREACREVASIERSELYHLRALQPEEVPHGIDKLFILIGKLIGADSSTWFKVKEMVASASFLGKVAGLDPRGLSDDAKASLTEVANDPDCEPDQISRPSTSQYIAAITLAKWVHMLHKEFQ
jgi:Ca2+-binding EF-hand superfamily protein